MIAGLDNFGNVRVETQLLRGAPEKYVRIAYRIIYDGKEERTGASRYDMLNSAGEHAALPEDAYLCAHDALGKLY